jgi:hypothetical protein
MDWSRELQVLPWFLGILVVMTGVLWAIGKFIERYPGRHDPNNPDSGAFMFGDGGGSTTDSGGPSGTSCDASGGGDSGGDGGGGDGGGGGD